MPWQIPVTEDQSGQIIANAVQNALMTRYQLGRQQKFDKLALAGQQQGLALGQANAAAEGIHFLQPGERAPYLGALPTPQSIQQATANAQPASSKQGPTGLWAPQSAPTSGTTESPFASMFGDMPRYVSGPGFYIDRYEGAFPKLLAASMAGYQKYNEKLGENRADPSAPALRIAEALKDTREANAPHLGDENYAPAMGAVAGAQARARVAPAVDQALQIARGEVPIAGAKAGAEEAARFPYQEKLMRLRAGYSPRAIAASSVLPTIEANMPVLDQYDQPGAASRLFGRSALGGYVVTKEGRAADVAATNLTRAYLSRNGRNPSPQQIEQSKQQILVQPGEENNDIVKANKAALRQQWHDEVQRMSMENPSANETVPGAGATPNGYDVARKYGIGGAP